jgi:hypothetical protein
MRTIFLVALYLIYLGIGFGQTINPEILHGDGDSRAAYLERGMSKLIQEYQSSNLGMLTIGDVSAQLLDDMFVVGLDFSKDEWKAKNADYINSDFFRISDEFYFGLDEKLLSTIALQAKFLAIEYAKLEQNDAMYSLAKTRTFIALYENPYMLLIPVEQLSYGGPISYGGVMKITDTAGNIYPVGVGQGEGVLPLEMLFYEFFGVSNLFVY